MSLVDQSTGQVTFLFSLLSVFCSIILTNFMNYQVPDSTGTFFSWNENCNIADVLIAIRYVAIYR